MRRGLLLALIALAAAGATPAMAADVSVAPAGGEPTTLSIAALQPSWDIRERPYTLRGADGEQAIVVSGISIDRLLDHAGVDPFAFAGATVSLAGQSVTLTREQLIDPGAFPEGRPVFSVDADGTHFLRPVTGPGDLNAGDRLTAAGGTITVSLTAPARLRVSASASRRRVEAGERVTFSAVVEGASAGEDVRVRWTFDDGGTASGTRVRHRFARPGTYKVVVGVTSDADPTGASAIVTVRVGEPAEGPDREGGGTDEDEDAPDSGAATGAGDEPAGGAATGSGDDRAAAAPRRSRSRGERAAARPPSARGERRRLRARPRRTERRRRAPAERGDEVAGVLLNASLPKTAAQAAARTGNPQPPAANGLDLPDEAAVALLALAMLGYGGWREWRRAALIHV